MLRLILCREEKIMKEYRWRGLTYQIADEDLKSYPGAEQVSPEPEAKAAPQPKNKGRKTTKNKGKE